MRPLRHLCHLAYFILGAAVVLFPSILPAVQAQLEVSLAAAGLVFPVKAVGSLAGGLLAGVASDRFGRKPLLIGAAAALAASLGVAGAAPHWWLFLAAYAVVGTAQGALSTAVNALAADLAAATPGRSLNWLHGVYGLGAALSPLLFAAVLSRPAAGWRAPVLGTAAVWATFLLLATAFRYPAPPPGTQRSIQLGLLRQGAFAALFAVAFIYNGVAWSLLGWLNAYLQQAGLAPTLATAMISLFYLALTAGRFACAHLSERWGYAKTLLLCAAGTALAYPAVVASGRPALVAAGVGLSGLFLSGLYPTALAFASRLAPQRAGTVTGTLSVGMTLGTMLPPWWTGALAQVSSFPVAIGANYLLVLPLLGIALYLLRTEAAGLPRASTARLSG